MGGFWSSVGGGGRKEETDAEGWLRPLGEMEEYLAREVRRGADVIAFTLSIATVRPLHPDVVSRALVGLYRGALNLRMCIQEKEGRPWFRLMPEERIDFEVLNEEVVEGDMKHHTEMLRHNFLESCGPLWCARLISVRDGQIRVQAEGNSRRRCHRYQLVLGFHHSIVDGTSTFILAGILLTQLKAAIEYMDPGDGLPRDLKGEGEEETEQHDRENGSPKINRTLRPLSRLYKKGDHPSTPRALVRFPSLAQDEWLLNVEYFKLFLNPWSRKREMDNVKFIMKPRVIFEKISPPVRNQDIRTLVLRKKFDEDLSMSLISRCKREGVTVHAAFTALANLSMSHLLRDRGVKQKEDYTIKGLHAVNLRRYWTGENVDKAVGLHIGVLPLQVFTDPDILQKEVFWEYVQKVHTELRASLASRGPVKGLLFYFLTTKEETKVEGEGRPSVHYGSSNIGCVDRFIPSEFLRDLAKEKGTPSDSQNHEQEPAIPSSVEELGADDQQIVLEDLLQSTSTQYQPFYCVLNFHTLNKRISLCIDYANNNLTTATSKKLLVTFEGLLRATLAENQSVS